MDWIVKINHALDYIKKNRVLMFALITGVFLMLIPVKEKTAEQHKPDEMQTTICLQDSLKSILSTVSGVGKVEVLLTQAEGEKTFFETDDEVTGDKTRKEVVLVANSSREETGLVRQINPPKYLGAVIVCQGGDSPGVQLSVVEAVMSVTGLTSDHITVLKMK